MTDDFDETTQERRPYPASLWILVAAALAYLIQIPPFPGIVLMFFLAAFWPMLLVYLSMLGVLLEVLARRVSPAWLALPLVPLAIYEAEAARQHMVARREVSTARAGNDRLTIPFDATRSDLVMSTRFTGTIGTDPEWLVSLSSLPRVFLKGQSSRSYVPAGGRQCAQVSALKLDAYVSDIHASEATGRGVPIDVACIVSTVADPTLPLTTVASETRPDVVDRVPLVRDATTVSTPDGGRHVIRKVVARPLSWYPFVVAGCYTELDVGSDWGCHFQPIRDRVSSSADEREDARTLLKALSVPAQPRDWPSYDAPDVVDALLARRTAQAQTAYETIEQAMREPAYAPRREDVEPILRDDARLRAIAPRLIAWTTERMHVQRPEGPSRCLRSEPDGPYCIWKATSSKRATFVDVLVRGAKGPLSDMSSEISLLSHRGDALRDLDRERAILAKRRREEERQRRDEDRALAFMRMQQRMISIRSPSTSPEERRRLIEEIEAERREASLRR